jgi:predicted transcriptional regulator
MRSLAPSLLGAVGALVLLGAGTAAGQPAAAPTGALPAAPPATAPQTPPAASQTVPADAAPPAAASAGVSLADYHAALAQKRLDPSGALGTEQLGHIIEVAETHLSLGRRDEAIAVLSAVVESPRFAPLAELDAGRAAVFLLGDALGRAGAYALAKDYLVRLLRSTKQDGWQRRAVSRLVDLGLESGDPTAFAAVLAGLPSVGAPWAGDVAYLRGVAEERVNEPARALAAYAQVPQDSRYWAQATYRAGLLEVDRGRLAAGEQLFCRIADPKQTPKVAPLFGGNDFFEIRDLSRLALGRVAHEQYRFDDARYYYHLVPGDSDRLPEALYESATARYEAKDYAGAHALIAELEALRRHHAYEDEALILDAYVDLARCEFPRADARLAEFLRRYEPVLSALRRLRGDGRALRALLGAEEPALASELGGSREVTDMIRSSIRVDSDYGTVTRQIADLDRELGGLAAARTEIADLSAALRGGGVVGRAAAPLADSQSDRLSRLDEQAAAVRRLLRDTAAGGRLPQNEIAAIRRELGAVEAEAAGLRERVTAAAPVAGAAGSGQSLPELLGRDAALVGELEQALRAKRDVLATHQEALAGDALARLDLRLSRLVRRARAGRIETVLGRKRALELEVEALSQGFLPQGAVDSLDAARYLSDDEEYWPFDGEDWEDEYIGGEGLR